MFLNYLSYNFFSPKFLWHLSLWCYCWCCWCCWYCSSHYCCCYRCRCCSCYISYRTFLVLIIIYNIYFLFVYSIYAPTFNPNMVRLLSFNNLCVCRIFGFGILTCGDLCLIYICLPICVDVCVGNHWSTNDYTKRLKRHFPLGTLSMIHS